MYYKQFVVCKSFEVDILPTSDGFLLEENTQCSLKTIAKVKPLLKLFSMGNICTYHSAGFGKYGPGYGTIFPVATTGHR